MAKEYLLREDTLLLESDLIFEDGVLQALANDPRDTLALVDKYESWMDGTCVKIGEDDTIIDFVPGKRFAFEDIPKYYKTVNIYKFSKYFSETHYVPFLEAYSRALGNNEYYEQVLRVITLLDDPGIKAKKLDGQMWYEIDDLQDLDIASSMFAPDEETKVRSIQERYGGYWRYPAMADFCYLVNPYFPPQKLMDEMKASFEPLLTGYPSGMKVNGLLAAKNFGVHREHILMGNGASELINCLMGKLSGKVGFIRPTFEEYPNRRGDRPREVFTPDNENFAYGADELTAFFAGKGIESLVLVNPDNPSGNYIGKKELLRLISWCAKESIRIIVDESFADFADEEDATLISEEIMEAYPNLVIIKSISKSYGVPGIRLGVMASSDEDLIAEMKRDVSIWNINSFGEFYMQIEEKYRQDYRESLVKLRKTRKNFAQALSEIPGLRVIPSQANYIMAEIDGGMTAGEVTGQLLKKYNILIKDLSNKVKREERQFVRIAVRGEDDNQKLIAAMKEIFNSEAKLNCKQEVKQ